MLWALIEFCRIDPAVSEPMMIEMFQNQVLGIVMDDFGPLTTFHVVVSDAMLSRTSRQSRGEHLDIA
jgi:hypothetical protein